MPVHDEEVRYAMLRPGQAVERRKRCPVAYLPIGTIEWHGPQNPLGADTLQAEGLALLCARRGGGLVFPPPASRSWKPMPPTATASRPLWSCPRRTSIPTGSRSPRPSRRCNTSGCSCTSSRRWRASGSRWACVDYLFLEDRFPEAGDHAAGWETSHLMALLPATVDLSALPAKGEPLTGIMGRMPPQDATADFGRRTLEESAEAILREVDHRMEHPQLYRQHGWSLREGLWKERGGA